MVPRKDNLSARALQTKWCWYCRDYKPFEHFGKNKSRKDGMSGECKAYQATLRSKWTRRDVHKQIARRFERMPQIKICDYCLNPVDKSLFLSNSGHFIYSRCPECRREAGRAYGRMNPQRVRESAKRHYRANADKCRARELKRKQKDKSAALVYYSGDPPFCVCCKDVHTEFLTIDHINGDGAFHRKKLGQGAPIYGWLRRNGFPEGFRVLCMNCNWSSGTWGYCPHGNLPIVPRRNTRRVAP